MLTPVKDSQPNIVLYEDIELNFEVARHLACISYVAVTWSIYDRLANVCGRLSAIQDFADNPKQNPKLCEDFLSEKKEFIGFLCSHYLKQAYAWPIKASYKIRNWLVHEGYEEGLTPLFAGNNIIDGFKLHADAIAHIQSCCAYSNDGDRINSCCLMFAEDPWLRKDLLPIFESYHAEIDTMYSAMLKWITDAFIGQIKAFTARE